MLEESRSRNEFEHLLIMAGPHFLGLLREEMSPALHKLVVHEISKNLAHQSLEDIRKHLPDILPV